MRLLIKILVGANQGAELHAFAQAQRSEMSEIE